jgi:hypothetical protein
MIWHRLHDRSLPDQDKDLAVTIDPGCNSCRDCSHWGRTSSCPRSKLLLPNNEVACMKFSRLREIGNVVYGAFSIMDIRS